MSRLFTLNLSLLVLLAPSATISNSQAKSPSQESVSALRLRAKKGDVKAQFDLGEVYFNQIGDYTQAAFWYREAAKRGHQEAQFDLARACSLGQGVPRNGAESVRWYKKAAEGSGTLLQRAATYNVGRAYKLGEGVPQDYAKAVSWFRKAAEAGNSNGYLELGYAYFAGEGVPQDYVESVRWFRMAAEAGNEYSQFRLGSAYFLGKGVPQDYVLAYMWANLSASGAPGLLPGFGQATAEDLEQRARFREEIAGKLTPEQLAEAQRLAREWKAAHP